MAHFLSDEPTTDDLLDRAAFVQKIGNTIASCKPPAVFGLHGDWGAGKTSTLYLLHHFLAGECPQCPDSLAVAAVDVWKKSGWTVDTHDHVAVIWFEAWRYQHESAPIVALLHEMRSQLSTRSRLWSKAKKLTEIAVKSAFFSLESVTKLIGFQASKIQETGERWEKDHLAETLPSHTLRDFLEQELGKLLPGKDRAKPSPRLIVLIDDLDRCEPQAAYRLLEGIKIYLNLPNCVFVLGVNQAAIESSLAEQLAKEKADNVSAAARLRARDYLEKICKNFWHITSFGKVDKLVQRWLDKAELAREMAANKALIQELGSIAAALLAEYDCLPANPRKIKGFVNTLVRFLEKSTWQPPAQIGQREEAVKRRAGLLLALACLYEFHPDVYRIVDSEPAFFEVVRKWCRPWSEGYTPHRLLAAFDERMGEVVTPPAAAATPAPAEFFQTNYPDPERGNLLRIQKLLTASWLQTTLDEVKECLL